MNETNVARDLREAALHAAWYLDRVLKDPSRGTAVQTAAARVALEAWHRCESAMNAQEVAR